MAERAHVQLVADVLDEFVEQFSFVQRAQLTTGEPRGARREQRRRVAARREKRRRAVHGEHHRLEDLSAALELLRRDLAHRGVGAGVGARAGPRRRRVRRQGDAERARRGGARQGVTDQPLLDHGARRVLREVRAHELRVRVEPQFRLLCRLLAAEQHRVVPRLRPRRSAPRPAQLTPAMLKPARHRLQRTAVDGELCRPADSIQLRAVVGPHEDGGYSCGTWRRRISLRATLTALLRRRSKRPQFSFVGGQQDSSNSAEKYILYYISNKISTTKVMCFRFTITTYCKHI